MVEFMVVSTFHEGTNMAEVLEIVAEEKAKVVELPMARWWDLVAYKISGTA